MPVLLPLTEYGIVFLSGAAVFYFKRREISVMIIKNRGEIPEEEIYSELQSSSFLTPHF